jgi:hypothetical protein
VLAAGERARASVANSLPTVAPVLRIGIREGMVERGDWLLKSLEQRLLNL